MRPVVIIGAGLAGSEAAWQLVKRNVPVRLYEMRPGKMTPAHHSGDFAELVCSNSLRGASLENAVGLLKEEMRRFDSIIMRAADATSVPAGGALAVNRHEFSQKVAELLLESPLLEVVREELTAIPEGPVIVATGPLTSPGLAEAIQQFTGQQYFYFYDAAAPIVTAESLNREIVFEASRYDKGDGAYLNCPFSREEYERFWEDLTKAEVSEAHLPNERAIFFEGCMPVEVLASRGRDTLRFGTMKPVGITDPRTGRRPYALVQLRPENRDGSLYNLVGFQTHLKWGEQQRVFRMIPGLENAEFARFGVMHRNTYINAPVVLLPTYQAQRRSDLFFAGQITGVEGYVESASSGLLAGLNCARIALGQTPLEFPATTAIGSLVQYICHADSRYFQPMNVNFGLMEPLGERVKGKKERHLMYSERALRILETYKTDFNL
ncbi:methylenetetrahydrofolate--tRNA-(uracil-5-)-methyltransferase [Hydrogenispora ethanolica]|jgi:methylenetetrahydrofolate--tRNA-(uracil-5-)-methyltransferase|uniref:Methylenetetrahydrofolate--tRNA-(uracil-5-)-methyltransferase TrmFO n=1 Tax=Hydrogenispora ethanolica TaxID=1082276 RepID=A0A4R1QV87_HYDET|nr:methylenetetrahydrofolate--tRNA-(uracil(54)-C(5))-methyltransferase (FADH(2)-oxidizing) TrmFO [Hydrogenispora ethanolica]TCL56485.1 methylenetetrahydrofolate--tRNA-(uracil-5-)-methyltransferase [Hydrogenispora ethanolica]